MITAEELRVDLKGVLEEEYSYENVSVELQGKRLVVRIQGKTFVILVTEARVD